jgi:acid phosphatase
MGEQVPLSGEGIPNDWKYVASRFVSMRGTVAFERLGCEVRSGWQGMKNETFVRILLNDAVYPVPSCKDGPGESCVLRMYREFVSGRLEEAGDLRRRCNVSAAVEEANGNGTSGRGASFFMDLGGAWLTSVVP